MAVCAFANDFPGNRKPGYLIIGVKDDGTPAGIEVTDDLLSKLGGLRDDGQIQPLPSLVVQRVQLECGNEVVVVEVQPSFMPPVRYKGKVHIRIGLRQAIASEQDERLLMERRVSNARSFDSAPCFGASLDDLALDLFYAYRAKVIAPEIIEENNRSMEHQLASLRFFDLSERLPTNAGVLLFGTDIRRYLEGAYVQYLRVAGSTLDGEIQDDRVFDGDLLTMLRQLDAFVKVLSERRPIETTALTEATVVRYPKVAIRELLMNAVMHRSYDSTAPIRFYEFDDRIEIQNPGGLFGEASKENFPTQNTYRNPVVAEAMKSLGFVNKFGRGVIRAQKSLRENGNQEAEFELNNFFVLVKLRARK